MKLSEAIILGSAAYPPNDGRTWFFPEGCGCALGRAWLVCGRTREEYIDLCWSSLRSFSPSSTYVFGSEWPWLIEYGQNLVGEISGMFFKVVAGEMSIDAIADYVRSIEPECGECCRFDCVCTSQPQQVVEKETVHVI